jgi:hypothetical protein
MTDNTIHGDSMQTQRSMNGPPVEDAGMERSPFTSGPVSRGRSIVRAGLIMLVVGATGALAYVSTRGQAQSTSPAPDHQHGAVPGEQAPGSVRLDADVARRVGVTFATAQSGAIASEIRAVGQVTFDETRVRAIAPKVDGWVEHLHVDFTGREVREGEPLLSIYSPMLVSAQEELLLALRLSKDVANGTEDGRRSAAELVTSARRRLGYWDISTTDVAALEQRGTVTRTLTLRAPVSGVVVEKAVISGQKIMAGETLFRVADLRTVWVEGRSSSATWQPFASGRACLWSCWRILARNTAARCPTSTRRWILPRARRAYAWSCRTRGSGSARECTPPWCFRACNVQAS